MKIAIVVGHNSVSKGAYRSIDGVPEFTWNADLAEMIRDHDPARIKVFHRLRIRGGYSAEVDRVYGQVNDWNATCSIELHFNGFAGPAEGCLTLSSGTPRSFALAREVQRRMLALMGNEDDGIEVRRRHDRGGRSLWQGRSPAIMTEPYFAGNDRYCQIADHYKDELAEAIYRGAVAFHKKEESR